jgi:hypothetical protein
MLEAGDPKVCVSKRILEQAYEIVEQNAQIPRDEGLIPSGYTELTAKWIERLRLVADGVTSTSVDRDNQSALCSGQLRISAEGVPDTREAPFDYQVKANLSEPDKPIVTVDVSRLQSSLAYILNAVAKPDFERAQQQRDERDDALVKVDEDEVRNTPGGLAKLQARSRESILQSKFSEAELSLIDRIYSADMMCMAPDARNRDSHCRKKVRLDREAKSHDLCSSGNEWYHCSREAELEEQRAALQGREEAVASTLAY